MTRSENDHFYVVVGVTRGRGRTLCGECIGAFKSRSSNCFHKSVQNLGMWIIHAEFICKDAMNWSVQMGKFQEYIPELSDECIHGRKTKMATVFRHPLSNENNLTIVEDQIYLTVLTSFLSSETNVVSILESTELMFSVENTLICRNNGCNTQNK